MAARKSKSKTPIQSDSSELGDSPLVPLRSLIPSVVGDLDGIHFEEKTMLDARSSVGSESSPSYPSQEPSLLEQLRAGLAQGLDARQILKPKMIHRDMTINFSLTSSPGSLNSTSNVSLPPERRRANPLTRKKKNDITVNFTMNDSTSSSGSLDATANITLPPERRHAANPLTRKTKKDVKLNFTMNESASSCDNLENESPVLLPNRQKPLFKKPAARKISIRLDDFSDSDTSKVHDESLPSGELQSQPNPLKSSLRSKALPAKNITFDILPDDPRSDAAMDAASEIRKSSSDDAPSQDHKVEKSKSEPERSSEPEVIHGINVTYDVLQNVSRSSDKPMNTVPVNNSGPSSELHNETCNESREIVSAERHPGINVPQISGQSSVDMQLALSGDESLQYSGRDSRPSIAHGDSVGESCTEMSPKADEAEATVGDRSGTQDPPVRATENAPILRRSRRGSKNVTIGSDSSGSKGLSEASGSAAEPCKSPSNTRSRQHKKSQALPDEANSAYVSETESKAFRRSANNERTASSPKPRNSISPPVGHDVESIVQDDAEVGETNEFNSLKDSPTKDFRVSPRANPLMRKKKNDITVNFTMNDSINLAESMDATADISLPPERRQAANPLTRKTKKHVKLSFTMNDSAASCDNPENESPILLPNRPKPLFKKPAARKPSIRLDDFSDSDTSKVHDESLPSSELQSQSNPLKSSLRSQAGSEKNITSDDLLDGSGCKEAMDKDSHQEPSSGSAPIQIPNVETLSKPEPERSPESDPGTTSNATLSSDALSLRRSMDDMPQSTLDFESESVQCSRQNSGLLNGSCNEFEGIVSAERHPGSESKEIVSAHGDPGHESKENVSAERHPTVSVSQSGGQSSDDMQLALSLDESLQYSGLDSSNSVAHGDSVGGSCAEMLIKADEAEATVRDQSGTTQDSKVRAPILRRSRRGSKNVTIESGYKGSLGDVSGSVAKPDKSTLNTRSRQPKTSKALPDDTNSSSVSESELKAFRRPVSDNRTAELRNCVTPRIWQDNVEPVVQDDAEVSERNEFNSLRVSLNAESLASSMHISHTGVGDVELRLVAPKEPQGLQEPNVDQLRSSLEPLKPMELCGIRKPSLCSTTALGNQEQPILDASPPALPVVRFSREGTISPVVPIEPETEHDGLAPLSPEKPVSHIRINDDDANCDVGSETPAQTTVSSLHLHLTTFEAADTTKMVSKSTVSRLSSIQGAVTVPPRNETSKIGQPTSDTLQNADNLDIQAVPTDSELHLAEHENAACNYKPKEDVAAVKKEVEGNNNTAGDNVINSSAVGCQPLAAQTMQTTATSLHLHLTSDSEAGSTHATAPIPPPASACPTAVEVGFVGNGKRLAHNHMKNSNAVEVSDQTSAAQCGTMGASLHLYLTTDTEAGDATCAPAPIPPNELACPTAVEIGFEGNEEHAAPDKMKNSNPGGGGSQASAVQSMSNSLRLHLTDTDDGDATAVPALMLPSNKADCIPPVAHNNEPEPPVPTNADPVVVASVIVPPEPLVSRKSKRKSVSFKPPTENLYHSPPDVSPLGENAESQAQTENGYEFSRIQMTTDISEIQPSPDKKKAKRHFTSTPIPTRKKPVSQGVFAVPQPLAAVQSADHQFTVPPVAPLTKRVSIHPVPDIITPLKDSQGEAGSSSSISDDASCENSLDISAIPKDVTAPKWRKAPHFIHSTPLHRPKAGLKRIKKKSEEPPAAPVTDDPPENQGEIKVVNCSVQTSHNLRSRSKVSSESVNGSELASQSPSESRSLRRSARRNQTVVQAEVKTSKSNDEHADNGPDVGSPANRVAIQDNTILSTRIESQSRTRGSRTRSTTGSGFKSYDSHRKMKSRRLFSDNENKSSTEPVHPAEEMESSPPKMPRSPLPSTSQLNAASTSQQDDELMSPAETSIAQSYAPSLPGTDENVSLIPDHQPDDYSDNESVVSGVSTGSSSSVPSHVRMRESFESQLSSFRHRSYRHKEKVEPERPHRNPEPPKLRSKYAISRRNPSSDLCLFDPLEIPVKKRKRSQTKKVKLFNPGPKWKKSKLLYAWLKKKLEPVLKLRTNLESERLVMELDRARVLVSHGHTRDALDLSIELLSRLKICSTKLELWGFLMKFMPFEFVREVVPMGGAFGKPFDPEQSFRPNDPIF